MLGPTADDIADKDDTGLDRAGPRSPPGPRAGGSCPGCSSDEVTAVYAGLRAATEHGDYRIVVHAGQRYACVGGIRSTGLTRVDGHRGARARRARATPGCVLGPGPTTLPAFRMPNIGEAVSRRSPRPSASPRTPTTAAIVCFCERVTRGEIRDALTATVPAVDLDGLRRRTRALMGRCQGFSCGAGCGRCSPRRLRPADGRRSSEEARRASPAASSCAGGRWRSSSSSASARPAASPATASTRASAFGTSAAVLGAGLRPPVRRAGARRGRRGPARRPWPPAGARRRRRSS